MLNSSERSIQSKYGEIIGKVKFLQNKNKILDAENKVLKDKINTLLESKNQGDSYVNDSHVSIEMKPNKKVLDYVGKAISEVQFRNTYTQDSLESVPLVAYRAILKANSLFGLK